MTKQELKPCPFCGGENIKLLADELTSLLGSKSANRICMNCGAQAPQKVWNTPIEARKCPLQDDR